MLYSRLSGRSRVPATVRRALVAAVVAIAFLAGPSMTGSQANANDLPFWEKSEAAQKVQKSRYKRASYKSSRHAYGSPGKKSAYASRKKLGGYAETSEPRQKKSKGYRVAALGDAAYGDDYQPKKSLSGGGVRWAASSGCLNGALRSVVYQVAANFGPVTVNSTCRSKGHNRAVGGAPRSQHLSGNAVDFRVHGNTRGVYAFLRSSGSIGGLKHYGGGLFHVDTGPRRTW
ncbi:MAG TPA: D-Ala-D-Ala carboxypeptidase family metallohydrolase [Hyphomicrobium sp.]|nr:D-Ala-D-Ala carboxypeptidase family metallohydrolase [Hyphomicrobium sp.]